MGNPQSVWYDVPMSGTYHIMVGDRGRVVLPADLRERAGLKSGTTLTLFDSPAGMVLMTREQLLERVREDLSGLDLVGELLRERRVAAELEDSSTASE